MDAQQFLMAHAEQQWDNKYNAFVNAVVPALWGKFTRIDSPIIWYDGTSGDSSAYVAELGDCKLVVLSVGNFKTKVSDSSTLGKLPASLAPLSDIHLRMDLTETAILAEWSGKGDLCIWGSITNKDQGQFATGWYLAKE